MREVANWDASKPALESNESASSGNVWLDEAIVNTSALLEHTKSWLSIYLADFTSVCYLLIGYCGYQSEITIDNRLFKLVHYFFKQYFCKASLRAPSSLIGKVCSDKVFIYPWLDNDCSGCIDLSFHPNSNCFGRNHRIPQGLVGVSVVAFERASLQPPNTHISATLTDRFLGLRQRQLRFIKGSTAKHRCWLRRWMQERWPIGRKPGWSVHVVWAPYAMSIQILDS